MDGFLINGNVIYSLREESQINFSNSKTVCTVSVPITTSAFYSVKLCTYLTHGVLTFLDTRCWLSVIFILQASFYLGFSRLMDQTKHGNAKIRI